MKTYNVTFSKDDWSFTVNANNLKEASSKAQMAKKGNDYKGTMSVRLLK